MEKRYSVLVEGLGGRYAEFNARNYEVVADSVGEAANVGVEEFEKEMAQEPDGERHLFYSVKVAEAINRVRLISRSKT